MNWCHDENPAVERFHEAKANQLIVLPFPQFVREGAHVDEPSVLLYTNTVKMLCHPGFSELRSLACSAPARLCLCLLARLLAIMSESSGPNVSPGDEERIDTISSISITKSRGQVSLTRA